MKTNFRFESIWFEANALIYEVTIQA